MRTNNFILKRDMLSIVNHSGSIVVWGCWAAPGTRGLYHITGIMTSAKNPANHQEEEWDIAYGLIHRWLQEATRFFFQAISFWRHCICCVDNDLDQMWLHRWWWNECVSFGRGVHPLHIFPFAVWTLFSSCFIAYSKILLFISGNSELIDVEINEYSVKSHSFTAISQLWLFCR